MSESNTTTIVATKGNVPTNIAPGGRHEEWTVQSSGSLVRIDTLGDGTHLVHCKTHDVWVVAKTAHEAWVLKTNPQTWCEGCEAAKAEKDANRAASANKKAENSPLKRALAKATDPAVIAGLEIAIANANPRPRVHKGERGEVEVTPKAEVVAPGTPEVQEPVTGHVETANERKARKAREKRAAQKAAQNA